MLFYSIRPPLLNISKRFLNHRTILPIKNRLITFSNYSNDAQYLIGITVCGTIGAASGFINSWKYKKESLKSSSYNSLIWLGYGIGFGSILLPPLLVVTVTLYSLHEMIESYKEKKRNKRKK